LVQPWPSGTNRANESHHFIRTATSVGYDWGMEARTRRLEFADFLCRLAAGTVNAIEWNRFIVPHYSDDRLEEIRRSVVRLRIGQAGAVQWSDSEIAALQHWSRELRGASAPKKRLD
jgi:hypothetical protein